MKKSDKKIEVSIREALTEVCEQALDQVTGFKWITHVVNYKSFPETLSIICVFGLDSELSEAMVAGRDHYLLKLIRAQLDNVGIHIESINRQVSFDSEEACEKENAGKWRERFKSLEYH